MNTAEFEGKLVSVRVGQDTEEEPYNVALHFAESTGNDKEFPPLMGKRVRIIIEEVSEEVRGAKRISQEEAARRLGLPANPKTGETTMKGDPIAVTENLTIDEVRKRIDELGKDQGQ